jgi:hypothetical protein
MLAIIIKQCFEICYLYILSVLIPSLKVFNFNIKNYDDLLKKSIQKLQLIFKKLDNLDTNSDIDTKINDTIKSNIEKHIKDKYGNCDISFDENISYDTESTISTLDEEYVYAMKIRSISKNEPIYEKMELNEIHVNTKNKLYYVKTFNGFECFDMPKKCLVKCDRN